MALCKRKHTEGLLHPEREREREKESEREQPAVLLNGIMLPLPRVKDRNEHSG